MSAVALRIARRVKHAAGVCRAGRRLYSLTSLRSDVSADQVAVRVAASPYEYPSGIGQVTEVGSSASSKFSAGDWVIHELPTSDSWDQTVVVNSSVVTAAPTNIPIEQSAMLLHTTGAAIRMIEDFGDLNAGDVVMNVGADSPVGQAVIQVAASKGLKTINIVKGDETYAQTVEHLYAIGADLVVADSYVGTDGYFTAAGTVGSNPKLVITGVPLPSTSVLDPVKKAGGKISAVRDVYEDLEESGSLSEVMASKGIIRALGDTKTVGYGPGAPASGNSFSMDSWLKESQPNARQALVDDASSLVESGEVLAYIKAVSCDDLEYAGDLSGSVEFKNRSVVVFG